MPPVAITVRMPDDLGERLRAAAYVTKMSQAALVRIALEDLLVRIEDAPVTP